MRRRRESGIFPHINYFVLFLTMTVVIKTYSENVLEEEVYNFCGGVSHESFFDCICCNQQMLTSGISFTQQWKICGDLNNNGTSNETVHDIMWQVYTCIVQNSVTSANNLTNYAETMTKQYPDDIKQQIMDIISTTDLQSDEGKSAIENLNAIRITYHNIERGVCEGKYVKRSLKSMSSCADGSDVLRENKHMRGDCCNGQQIPIRLDYLRRAASKEIQNCTRNFVLTAGGVNQYIQSSDPAKDHQQYQTDRLHFSTSDSQQTCLQACTAFQNYNESAPPRMDPATYAAFDFMKVAHHFVSFFPQPLKNKILKKVINQTDDLQMEVDQFLNHNLDQLILREFSPTVNMTLIRRLFNTCEAYNLVTRKIEASLYEICQGKEKVDDIGP